MPIKLPPPKPKVGKGERSAFDAYVAAHPVLKPYATDIWNYAAAYGGFTATQVASVILFEGGYDKSGKPLNKPNAQGTGFGLAQINPKVWFGHVFPPTGETIDAAWASNPTNAVHFTAWLLHSARTHGLTSLHDAYGGDSPYAYNNGYFTQNPGKKGPDGLLPKGYAGIGGPTPESKAATTIAASTAKADITDPWVVVKNGKITTQTGDPPSNALKYATMPMRLSDFNRVWTQTYADTFFAYTGRHARADEIVQILKTPPTPTTLGQRLAALPGFVHSPVWKAQAPGFIADARSIMGQSWKPPKGFIAQALAQNWSQTTFEAKVRAQPEYLKSTEFTNNYDANKAHFEAIYGTADANTQRFIKDRTLEGWTPGQMESWLRAQPAYKQSPEFQTKALAFAQQLGLITGAVPTVSQTPVTTQKTKATNPNRVPGPQDINGDGLVVNGYAP